MPAKKTTKKTAKVASAKTPAPIETPPPTPVPPASANRKFLYIGIGILVILLAGAYLFKNQLVVATVNGQYITRAAYIKELEKQGGQQILEQMVTEKLILSEAQKQGVSVPPEDIEQEISAIRTRVEGQGMNFDEALAQQNMTLGQLQQQITMQKLVAAMSASDSAVTDADVDAYIKDNVDSLPDKAETNEELRSAIKDQLAQTKQQDAVNQWLEDLKAQADIQYW